MIALSEKTKDILKEFSTKIQDLSSEEIELLFEAFFTPQELDTLAKRYLLIEKLIEGEAQRIISQELGISISQISRGSRELQYGAGAKIFRKLFNK